MPYRFIRYIVPFLLVGLSLNLYAQEDEEDVVEIVEEDIYDNENYDIVEAPANTTDGDVYYEEDEIYYEDDEVFRDNYAYTNREFSNNLSDKYSGEEFDYTEKPEEEEKEINDDSDINISWIGGLGRLMLYLLIGIGILAIAYIIFIIVKQWGNRSYTSTIKNKNWVDVNTVEENPEDITEHNFVQLAQEAESQHNYRLAYRYWFLYALQQLQEKSKIKWQKNKTNMEYLSELTNTSLYDAYKEQVFSFNYIWYGKFNLTENQYHTVKNNIQEFIKNIAN